MKGTPAMAQSTTDRYSVPVARPAFSLFKSDTEPKGTPAMTASKKLTGAAAKSSRQSKLSVVRPTDEQQPTQQQQEQQPVNTQPTTEQIPVTEYTQVTLADMMAQRRAIDEQIKAAKATQPKVEKQPKPAKTLHDVVEQQEASVGIGHCLYIASRALARVKMGQDPEQAVNAVAAREGEAAKGALEFMATGDYPDLRSALMAWCSANAPATVVKQHTAISEGDTTDEQ